MSYSVITKIFAVSVFLSLSAHLLRAFFYSPENLVFMLAFNVVSLYSFNQLGLCAIAGILIFNAYSRIHHFPLLWKISSSNRPKTDDKPAFPTSKSSDNAWSSSHDLPKIILPENEILLKDTDAEDADHDDYESTDECKESLANNDTPPPVFLCIICREAGHHMDQCRFPEAAEAEDWTLARLSTSSPYSSVLELGNEVCSRCQRLDITNIFKNPNFTSSKDASEFRSLWRKTDGQKTLHTLGSCEYVRFHQSCPICRLLFSTIPPCKNRNSYLVVVPAWVCQRQESALTSKYRDASFETCLYVALESYSESMTLCSEARDTICILESNRGPNAINPLVITGRKIQQSVDFALLRSWLDHCNDLHDTYCREIWSESLRNIRLIDVKSRKIVNFPGTKPCKYLALSYVWGKMAQRSCAVGSKIGRVAGSIEDAIEATKMLGMRYLWVDSLCIDQRESAHKAGQIKLMSAIYRGAFATIVALSGRCAESGLPRVVHRRKRYPDVVFPQLNCNLSDQVLGTTMPTLKQQISRSPWTKRAWTYQEGLLSSRCLYFTQHQVYFECNMTQCCETLDNSRFPTHSEKRLKLNPAYYTRPANVLGKGFLTNPFLGLSDYSNNQRDMNVHVLRLLCYSQIIVPYTTRKMTNQSDAIEAVSGLLQQLETQYYAESGFCWGLPCEDFALALLWKQGKSRRRAEFPSWSWAGWEGKMLEAHLKSTAANKWIATPLEVYTTVDGSRVAVCENIEEDEDVKYTLPGRPPKVNDRRYLSPWRLLSFLPEIATELAQQSGIIFVHGIVLSFTFSTISGRNTLLPIIPSNPREIIEELPVKLRDWEARKWEKTWWSGGLLHDDSWKNDDILQELNIHANQRRDFLLVARDQHHDGVRHHLLLLDQGKWQHHEQVYTRVGAVSLLLKYPKYDLAELNARRVWIAVA
ncbi:hypothetical protein ACEPPN_007663 [Leptodophora sp. 'Broadleaf-Isolate-01']